MAEGKDRIIIDVLGNTRPLEKEIQRVANQSLTLNTKGFSAPLGKISGQLGEFEKSLAASNARVIAFGASAGAIYAVQKAFQETIKSVIDVEKALTDINVILNVSQKSLSEFGSGLFKIAKDTGTSFQEVTRAATEFSRQGLGVTDTLKRTSDALILTRLSGLDVVSSVEAITAALNSFNQTSITSNELVNKLAAVDASFAVSSGDLAEAIKRVGSSAQDAGVSIDQLVALVTSAQQTTARGGAVIGNSFKTIFTRLERPKVLDALEELGIKTRDIEGNALPVIQVLQELSKTFDTLSGSQKAQISELVGGVFQINILKAALSDLSKEYSIYGQALNISTTATDEANQRNEALNKTLAATINKTLANLQGAASQIGQVAFGPAIERALGGLNSVLENFGESKDTQSIGEKIGQGLLAGLGNFLSGPGLLLGLATTFKVFERLTVFASDAFKSLSSISTQNANQQALQTQILNLLGKNPQIIEQINKGNLSTTSLHTQILTLIEQETAAMQQQVAIANTLAKSLSAVGVNVATTGPYKGAAISRNKALGFIPNFSASDEITGALMGGYSPGSIKKTSIPNYGQVTYNSAEKVKKFNGLSQQAIMPPEKSPAGQAYKNNFQNIHGFNPYASKGFVPNFAIPDRTDAMISKGYIRISGAEATQYLQRTNGQLKDTATSLGVVNDKGNLYVPQGNYNKLINNLKTNLETKAVGRGEELEGKLNPYALVYPSFQQSTSFGTYGTAGGKKIGFYAVPFPGQLKNKDREMIGPGLYAGAIDGIVNTASNFLNDLAGVSPEVINSNKFKNYLKSNISQDQIGSLVGNAFEGGVLSALNIIPDDRTRNLDLTSAELKKLGETFKVNPLMGTNYRGGDFKNSLSGGNLDSMASKILTNQNAAFGFIPNFSPIKKALNAEKSLGGNGVLDFEPGFGLYVRDKKTQKNFSDVKKDHPEGLKKAISNSFGIQKNMAAFGFIPNFAATLPTLSPQEAAGNNEIAKRMATLTPELDSSIKNLSASLKKASNSFNQLGSSAEKASNEIQSENLGSTVAQTNTKITKLGDLFNDDKIPANLQKFKQGLGFASIGISMAGGFLAETFGSDNKALKDNINGFTQGLSTASTAVMLIPGPIGLVIGGFTALYAAVSSVTKYMKQNGEDLGKKLEDSKQAASDFANSSQNLSQIQQKLADAYKNTKTSPAELDKLNKQLIDAVSDLPEKYRMQLLGIGDNIKLQEEMTKVQGELVKEQKNLEFASAYSAKLLDSAFTTPDVFKNLSDLNSAAKSILAGFSKEGKTNFIANVEDQAVNLTKSSQTEFIKYLKEFYGLNSSIAGALEKANPQEINNLKTALIKLGTDAKSSRDAVEAGAESRKAEILKLESLKKAADAADAAVENLNDSLLGLISASISGSEFKSQNRQNELANQSAIELNRATGNLNARSDFSSPESVSRVQNIIDSQRRNEDTLKSFRDTISGSRNEISSAVQDLLKKLSSPDSGLSASPEIIKQLGQRYMNIGSQNLNPKDYANAIYKATMDLMGPTNTRASGLQDKLISINQQANQRLLMISQEAIKNNQIAQDNYKIQQQMLQDKRDVSAMGGLEGYASGGSYDKIRQILQDFKKTGGGGQSRAALLGETINLAGGGFNEKFLKGLTPFTNTLKTQRAQDIRSNALSIAKNSPGGIAPIFRDIAKRSYDIASKQVDFAIKSSQADAELGLNVKSILGILEKANLSQQQSAKEINLPGNLDNAKKGLERDYKSEYKSIEEEIKRAQNIAASNRSYQGLGEEIGQKSSRIDYMEKRKAQIQKENESLIQQLEASNLPEKIKTFLLDQVNQALASGQQIPSTSKLQEAFTSKYGANRSQQGMEANPNINYDLEKQLNELKKLNIESILGDLSKNQTDTQAIKTNIEGISEALRRANEEAQIMKKALEAVGEKPIDITAPINRTNNQSSTIQIDTKPISLNIPENPINLQMGGNITVDPINFNVSLDQATDLTSMITPIAEKIVTDINLALTDSLQQQISTLKQQISDLGGRRLPPERMLV